MGIMKICTKCKKEKELCNFRARKTLKSGYNSWCKDCENEANKLRYTAVDKNKEAKIINLEEKKHKQHVRMLKHRYNITYEQYISMYEIQNRCCAICKISKKLGGTKGLYVDHSHSTGKVRGLLCPSCNSAIGKLKENEEILKNAIEYLNAPVP